MTCDEELPAPSVCGYASCVRDKCWVKSRIAARILFRGCRGALRPRDRRLARSLADDPAVTDRLIDQALASICAEKGLPPDEYHRILRRILATDG